MAETFKIYIYPNEEISGDLIGAYTDIDDEHDNPDDDTTYVTADEEGDPEEYASSLYGFQNPSDIGLITKVTVYYRYKTISDDPGYVIGVYCRLLVDALEYYNVDPDAEASENYVTLSKSWSQNPRTEANWTWTQINDLAAQILINGCSAGNGRCTQLYIEIEGYYYTKPDVAIHNATDILQDSFRANGEIENIWGKTCSERGFEYGLTKTYTSFVKDDAGGYDVGTFSKDITGLQTNTTYWIRAYAVNSEGTGYSEWLQVQTATEGVIPTGTKINTCSDYSGYTYKLMRSALDDGDTYEGYFVISTDLTNKRGLAYYKRILDLWLYFNKEDSGSVDVYVKRDSEPDWQTVGTVTLTGTDDIVIKHLAPDIRGKHFLFKISASNHFEFLGCLFEAIRVGMR